MSVNWTYLRIFFVELTNIYDFIVLDFIVISHQIKAVVCDLQICIQGYKCSYKGICLTVFEFYTECIIHFNFSSENM